MSRNNIPFLKPMLAVDSNPFNSENYLFEIKWDGYRCLFYFEGKIKLISRNGNNLTDTFPEFCTVNFFENIKPCLFDGEIIVLNNGLPSFNNLQQRGRLKDKIKVKSAAVKYPAVFVVFDILYINGREIMKLPLLKRKKYYLATLKLQIICCYLSMS